jgi:acyl carrier protein
MERLPLTSNGKVDRRSLPAPDGDKALERPYLPPETALELQLTNIWQEILGAERIGVTDNFFELGGHSIFAMRLSFAIEQALGIELPGGILYQQPNIRLLAGAISGLGPTADSLQEGYSEIRL